VSHDDENFVWDGPALRDEALDRLHGAHSALTSDGRTDEVLCGIGFALLALYEQRSDFYQEVVAVLSDAKGRSR
jgi:hypothetical protein